MLANVATRVALRKVGLPSSTVDFDIFSSSPSDPPRQPNKLRKPRPQPRQDDEDDNSTAWPSWMSLRSLPLSVQPWFTPPPPPVDVAVVPRVGDAAPTEGNGKLQLGRGSRVLLVFLRCVGCAFAQKCFIALRTLANRYAGSIHCVAVSHSSQQATQRWIDLLGGAWNIEVVIDEDRSLYAAWGLGLGSVWYLFNPTTQAQGWKEKGWLGETVAGELQRRGADGPVDASEHRRDPSTAMGTKWQEAGAFAVDGQATVIWGGKATRADDMLDLEEGARLLLL